MVLVLFANTNFEMYLLRVLLFNSGIEVQCVSVSKHVGSGVGVGSYQPGVYMPLKALFLVR